MYAALDEELAGLPERLRVPLVLHYLEGKTQDEVARILGCSRSVALRRLAKGEAILRKRLERRGLSGGDRVDGRLADEFGRGFGGAGPPDWQHGTGGGGVPLRHPHRRGGGGGTGGVKEAKIKNFKPSDWNEIDITVKGTEATCKCNGEMIGKPMKIPETGTIGLQSEIGKFEFRRIRVKEPP